MKWETLERAVLSLAGAVLMAWLLVAGRTAGHVPGQADHPAVQADEGVLRAASGGLPVGGFQL